MNLPPLSEPRHGADACADRRRTSVMRWRDRAVAILAAGLACAGVARAAGAAEHPWITSPLPAEQPASYFTNLRDGDTVESPFVLRFGLTRYGLAPITKPVAQTGHHHLLVNRELPLDFTQPLPFNDQYIHFGKGQMETVLNFAPGAYTLRLLMADHKHIPYFIYSKPVRITVSRQRADVDPKTLVEPGVRLLSPREGEAVKSPMRVQLHASGLNVGHSEIQDPGVGHFRVVAQRGSAAPERIALTNGYTEVWLAPPPGRYQMHVELVANAPPHGVMARSAPIAVEIKR